MQDRGRGRLFVPSSLPPNMSMNASSFHPDFYPSSSFHPDFYPSSSFPPNFLSPYSFQPDFHPSSTFRPDFYSSSFRPDLYPPPSSSFRPDYLPYPVTSPKLAYASPLRPPDPPSQLYPPRPADVRGGGAKLLIGRLQRIEGELAKLRSLQHDRTKHSTPVASRLRRFCCFCGAQLLGRGNFCMSCGEKLPTSPWGVREDTDESNEQGKEGEEADAGCGVSCDSPLTRALAGQERNVGVKKQLRPKPRGDEASRMLVKQTEQAQAQTKVLEQAQAQTRVLEQAQAQTRVLEQAEEVGRRRQEQQEEFEIKVEEQQQEEEVEVDSGELEPVNQQTGELEAEGDRDRKGPGASEGLVVEEAGVINAQVDSDEDEGEGAAADEGSEQEAEGVEEGHEPPSAGGEEEGEYEVEGGYEGDELLAVKPWLGTLKALDDIGFDGVAPPVQVKTAASKRLRLQHVHGFRGSQSLEEGSAMARFSRGGKFVMSAAAVGVVHDGSEKEQQLFLHHSSEISCMTVDPTGSLAASADQGMRQAKGRTAANILVWSTEELTLRRRYSSSGGCRCLSFSHDSKRLVSVGADQDNMLMVWCPEDESREAQVAQEKGAPNGKILACSFAPVAVAGKYVFVTVGIKHVRFWEVEEAKERWKLTKKSGGSATESAVSVDFVRSPKGSEVQVLTGMHDGSMLVWKWEGRKPLRKLEGLLRYDAMLHVAVVLERELVVCGDSEGKVCVFEAANLLEENCQPFSVWDLKLVKVEDAGVGERRKDDKMCVRSLSVRAENNQTSVLVGTSLNEILLISTDETFQTCQVKKVTGGHSSKNFEPPEVKVKTTTGELWGLAAHPQQEMFATCGYDGVVRVWSLTERKTLSFTYLEEEGARVGGRALAFKNPEGRELAVGLKSGTVLVYLLGEDTSLSLLTALKARKREVSDVKYSGDGKRLAVGTRENFIDVYAAEGEGYRRTHVCQGHSSAILHVDWSESGEWLQSCDSSYEVLYWRLEETQEEAAALVKEALVKEALVKEALVKEALVKPHARLADLKGQQWVSMTSPISWTCIGVVGSSGTEVKAVARSGDKTFLLAGTDKREVCVYDYPAVAGCQGAAYAGHASFVTNVAISQSSKFAVSVGGRDACVLQWSIE